MERRGTNGYIYIGTAVRYLMDARAGMSAHRDGALVENIRSLKRRLEEYEFFVTERVAAKLFKLGDELEAELLEHPGDDSWRESRLITASEAQTMSAEAKTIRETMLAEARGKIAFIAVDKRYTVEKLLDDVGSLMGTGVFDSLSDLAKYDFQEGCRAIAFDLPTAAAFHILRGTEDALRRFYCAVVRRDRIAEPRMWAAMIVNMRSKRSSPPALLLDNLDSLRSNFRNPTQHPEKTYDIDEVQDLLSLSIDSVNRMERHLASIGRATSS